MNSFFLRPTGKTPLLLMAVLVLSAMVLFAGSPSVIASGSGSSSSVDSVNLKSGKWVYSIYIDKNKTRYAAITRYDGDELNVVIPSDFDGIPVKTVSREAFCNNKYMTSVLIPDSVTEIGKYAFSGCVGLGKVNYSSSLTTIGEGAFYGCWSLTEAVFPEGTQKIGSFSFYNCRHLKKIVFPSSLKSIGNSAFEGCSMLESVSFGENLETVGDTAFKGCTSLTKADVSSVKKLGTGAFMKCAGLETVVIGDHIGDIRPETFRGCVSLKSVVFGKDLKTIGVSAFEGCEALASLPVINPLESIASLAFKGCVSLRTAEIGPEVSKIGFCAFGGCAALEKISVSEKNESFSSFNGCLYTKDRTKLLLCPQGFKGKLKTDENISVIGDYAAAGCTSVRGAELGENTLEIGRAAFLGCTDVTALSVPEKVEKIGSAALGMYLFGGKMKKVDYLKIYGGAGSAAESYCSQREMTFIPYSSTLYVSSERVVLEEKKSFNLTCGFSSGKKGKITWESSDESVVTVKDGKLHAVSQGNAEVTASAEGFDPAAVKVSVVQARGKKAANSKSTVTRLIYCGEHEGLGSLLSQLIDPIFSSDRYWYSSAPAVASVNNDGEVFAHSRGNAAVTCHMPDGSETIFIVTVTEKPTELTLIAPDDELIIGEKKSILKNLYPSVSSDVITWETDNQNIATVDADGRITAVGQGECTVTAIAESGLKSSVSVRCVIPAEKITLDMDARNVYQGKEFNLTASLTPQNSSQKIRWSSSDPSVASVNSKGKVTGKSFGTAVIIARTSLGVTAECRVNVIAKAEELVLDVKNLSINCGSVYKLNALIRPSYSPETTDSCTWNTTDESVAVVDEEGNVTAVGPGRCIINCRTSGDLISKCRLQVNLPAESVEINSEKDTLYIGEVLQLKAVITPEKSTDSLEWSSSDSSVARVTSGGSVKGVSVGTAVITAKVTNGVTNESVTATFEINILKKADSVKLSQNSLSLLCGEKNFLTYTLLPDDSNDTVAWSSTDESVASVRDDGLITAIAPGTCYIRIETGSGSSAKCKVTVK